MSFTEQQEDKIITFALSPKDYYYELKLAKSLYKIDKKDLAVWAHNFAIGALSRQLGQLYVVSSFKKKDYDLRSFSLFMIKRISERSVTGDHSL